MPPETRVPLSDRPAAPIWVRRAEIALERLTDREPPAEAASQIGWFEPDGAAVIAWGEAAVLDTDGPEGAAALPERAREWLVQAGDAAAGLRFFGGVAFDPAAPGTPLGGECPAARFVLPAVTLRQTAPGRCEAVLALRARPDEPAHDAEARLEAAWCDLEAWASRPARTSALVPAVPARDAEAPARHRARIEQALSAIAGGTVAKVVLARPLVLRGRADLEAWPIWRMLNDRAPTTTRFLFRFADGSAFVGATPEVLFAQAGRELSLDALAGTAPRHADPEADEAAAQALLESNKDQREHAWVVHAIEAALAPHTEAIHRPAAPALKRLPTVAHLHTPITARLRPGVTLESLVRALHPTPAVGGWPRERAIELIRALEEAPRGWYAGPVGWVGRDEAHFVVAIRSAYLAGPAAVLMAGGGIVAGSEPEAEWAETVRKAAPLVRLLTGED